MTPGTRCESCGVSENPDAETGNSWGWTCSECGRYHRRERRAATLSEAFKYAFTATTDVMMDEDNAIMAASGAVGMSLIVFVVFAGVTDGEGDPGHLIWWLGVGQLPIIVGYFIAVYRAIRVEFSYRNVIFRVGAGSAGAVAGATASAGLGVLALVVVLAWATAVAIGTLMLFMSFAILTAPFRR